MIKVNVVKLKDELEQLKTIMDEYETVELNLFNQLKNSCNDWNDPRTPAFIEAVDKEKKESSNIVDSFKDATDCLNYIILQYETIGDMISVNLEKKASIIKAYGTIENRINAILSNINSVDMSFYYSELHNIKDMRNSFENLKVELVDSREKVKDLFKKIERIEENVSSKAKALKDIEINAFDYVLDY
ncbi:MAG: hypothetical protein IJL76_03790 [Bacilli bacterium]|nr:hypothetical protein [Bacilli bacterium]